MEKKRIVVLGATGSQGKGVVSALVNEGAFTVRAVSRHPETYSGKAAEVVKADLDNTDSLKNAFTNAYGVFVVTNFWEGADEFAQGRNAVEAAIAANVQHFIWSTLPNVDSISRGEFDVPHFTGKAKVDALVTSAGFKYHTFVQPPFYYQNLTGMMAPRQKDDGTVGWTLPIDPARKVIHMSDIDDLGKVVAGAFLQPERVGDGACLSLATELNSFNDIITSFKGHGRDYSFTRVPGHVFSTFFEGAKELTEMLGYFEKYTYMGPDAGTRIEAAKQTASGEFTSFEQWLKEAMKK